MSEELLFDKEEIPSLVLQTKAAKDLRDLLQVEAVLERTFVVVLAIHNNQENNSLTKIFCKRGMPISGYLYDPQAECYHIECCNYLQLGYIPISYCMSMPSVANWYQRIPMPGAAIRRFLNAQQRRDLKIFKAAYKNGYTFHFLQVIDCF